MRDALQVDAGGRFSLRVATGVNSPWPPFRFASADRQLPVGRWLPRHSAGPAPSRPAPPATTGAANPAQAQVPTGFVPASRAKLRNIHWCAGSRAGAGHADGVGAAGFQVQPFAPGAVRPAFRRQPARACQVPHISMPVVLPSILLAKTNWRPAGRQVLGA